MSGQVRRVVVLGSLIVLTSSLAYSPGASASPSGDTLVSGHVIDCGGQPRVATPKKVVLFPLRPRLPMRSAGISVGGGFRVLHIAPAEYLIKVPGGLARQIKVRSGRDHRISLLGCYPTIGGRYRLASPAQVRAFERTAKAGVIAAFVGRYRLVERPSFRFAWAQRGESARREYPSGGGSYRFYERTWRGQLLLVQKRGEADVCQERASSHLWGCGRDGTPASIGEFLSRLSFDQEAVSDEFLDPGNTSWLWTGYVHGIASRCLRSFSRRIRSTWCVADADGVFDLVSTGDECIEMTHLFAGVPAKTLFSLPSDIGRGPGPPLIAQYAVPRLLPVPHASRKRRRRSH